MSFVIISPSRQTPLNGAPDPGEEEASATCQEAEITRRVREELKKSHAGAVQEGREAGLAEGRKAGFEEAIIPLQSASAALREAWAQLAAPLAKKEHDLADLVTDLAFELARHIIGTELSASPTSLKQLVAQLVQEAAEERGPGQNILVRLNPVDHESIVKFCNFDDVALLPDIKISRGGALLEIFSNGNDASDKLTWDATIEARIETIRAALALNKVDAA